MTAGPGGNIEAMDALEPELTEDEVNDMLDGDEQDVGWDADDEYEWVR